MIIIVIMTLLNEPFVAVHRQVPTSRGVDVDEDIRALLEALWAVGLDTEFSCQGERGGLAHVCFSNAAHARRFMAGPGELALTVGARRAWVDFPSGQIELLTRYWASSDEWRRRDSVAL